MTDVDVTVVGAGVAGLAAARAVRAAGRSCVVLEAGGRIGGRAHTVMVGDDPFDTGANWLHAAERNPLADIARDAGETLRDSNRDLHWRPLVEGREASAAERADHDATEDAVERRVEAAASAEADMSFADAVSPLAAQPWLASIEMFEATLVAAADSRDLSVRDAHANALGGGNIWVKGGLGAFVARQLATAVRLDTPVSRVERGVMPTLHTPDGTLRARAVVVTVSTGVLRAGALRVTPSLPQTHLAALDGLPMGLLTKVALVTAGDRLGLADSTRVEMRLAERHGRGLSLIAWPFGMAHLVGFVGGTVAWELARSGEAGRYACERAAAMLGTRAIRAAAVTDWSSDPLFLGAYAYARVGHATARQALAEPLDGGRLVFAGEAVAPDGLAGTVGGAWRSGLAAAETVLRAIG